VGHGAELNWRTRAVRQFWAGVGRLTLCAGMFSLLVAAAFGQPTPNARPTSGTVVAGQATISFGPRVVNISATTPQVVIEWQSFDIGAKQQVVITGPAANATVLNRVIGPKPSRIAGTLKSNGQVYLVNGSGAAYYQGAQVDVSGFVSTSTNITNQNFMTGQLVFENAGNSNAIIANGGEIRVANGGMLALIAPGVANAGTLRAPQGGIALASASTFQLNVGPTCPFVFSPNVPFCVTSPILTTIRSDLVVNTGTIRARAGGVLLVASVAANVVGSVRVGGEVRTKTANGHPGLVIVSGIGVGVVANGTLDASGTQTGDVGGEVQVLGSSTELAATSVVDASGDAGGGVVAIGTNLARAMGGPSVAVTQLSNTVLIDQGAQVAADALIAGNGGRVTVLSSAQTTMAGVITARGGGQSGNGGFVETSGGNLSVSGTAQVDVSAPAGSTGTWLLDPFDFIVTTPVANAFSAHLLAGGSGKLIVQADHDIEVDVAIDGRGGAPGTPLILVAGNQVRLNADIFTNNAPIEIDAGAGSVLASTGTALCAGAFSITDKSKGSTGRQEPYSPSPISCSLPPTR
jgi:filamentous hemagglutinin family protein